MLKLHSVERHGNIIMSGESAIIGKEKAVVYLKVLSWYSHGRTEENREKLVRIADN
jgi:hypothetical protein